MHMHTSPYIDQGVKTRMRLSWRCQIPHNSNTGHDLTRGVRRQETEKCNKLEVSRGMGGARLQRNGMDSPMFLIVFVWKFFHPEY